MRTNIPPGLEHLASALPTARGLTDHEQPPAPEVSRKRQRRKASELEAPGMKSSTACGLEGCEENIAGNQRHGRAHIRSHYAGLIAETKNAEKGHANKLFFCTFRNSSGEECGEGGYAWIDGVQRHIEDVHWGRKFVCPVCGKQFSRRDVMKRHQSGCNGGHRHPSPPPGARSE
ncbi:hypothetical protein C8Q78DRAFT_568622 [Trametes maxima]|nr:hypothetical protein C8Q78DRAFT_568622 [Trametes maxima]